MCISDNYWLGTKKPSVTYGLRHASHFLNDSVVALLMGRGLLRLPRLFRFAVLAFATVLFRFDTLFISFNSELNIVIKSYYLIMYSGLVYYFVEISCASRDLHSGSHGGSVYEPFCLISQFRYGCIFQLLLLHILTFQVQNVCD